MINKIILFNLVLYVLNFMLLDAKAYYVRNTTISFDGILIETSKGVKYQLTEARKKKELQKDDYPVIVTYNNIACPAPQPILEISTPGCDTISGISYYKDYPETLDPRCLPLRHVNWCM